MREFTLHYTSSQLVNIATVTTYKMDLNIRLIDSWLHLFKTCFLLSGTHRNMLTLMLLEVIQDGRRTCTRYLTFNRPLYYHRIFEKITCRNIEPFLYHTQLFKICSFGQYVKQETRPIIKIHPHCLIRFFPIAIWHKQITDFILRTKIISSITLNKYKHWAKKKKVTLI